MKTVTITGNTYPVKDALKAMGARWNATAKGWDVPAAKASAAQALVTGAPKQAFTAFTAVAQRPTGSARYYGRSVDGCDSCRGRGCDDCR